MPGGRGQSHSDGSGRAAYAAAATDGGQGAGSYAGNLLYRIYQWLPYEILLAEFPGVASFQSSPTPAILEISWQMIGRAWIIGGFWFILANAVGLHFFRRKEIK